MEHDPTKDGLSNKIKIAIIVLTFITLCAMGGLFIKIVYSISSSEKQSGSHQYLLNVGDKLKEKGLNEQAIDQYIKYLEKSKSNVLSHSMIAHTIGELYMELSNCREALVWLFYAEATDTTYHRANDLKKHIDTCSAQINSSEPTNLNTK